MRCVLSRTASGMSTLSSLKTAFTFLKGLAARIVSNSRYDTSATLLIKNLKRLTANDMIKSETATVTYKAITGLTPSYLSNFLTNKSYCYLKICVPSDYRL